MDFLLKVLFAPLAILNVFGAIGSFIWLIILGEWFTIINGFMSNVCTYGTDLQDLIREDFGLIVTAKE